jgi:hypothetical protein
LKCFTATTSLRDRSSSRPANFRNPAVERSIKTNKPPQPETIAKIA